MSHQHRKRRNSKEVLTTFQHSHTVRTTTPSPESNKQQQSRPCTPDCNKHQSRPRTPEFVLPVCSLDCNEHQSRPHTPEFVVPLCISSSESEGKQQRSRSCSPDPLKATRKESLVYTKLDLICQPKVLLCPKHQSSQTPGCPHCEQQIQTSPRKSKPKEESCKRNHIPCTSPKEDQLPCTKFDPCARAKDEPHPSDQYPCPKHETCARPKEEPRPSDQYPCPKKETCIRPKEEPRPSDQYPCPKHETCVRSKEESRPIDQFLCPKHENLVRPKVEPCPFPKTSPCAQAIEDPCSRGKKPTPCPRSSCTMPKSSGSSSPDSSRKSSPYPCRKSSPTQLLICAREESSGEDDKNDQRMSVQCVMVQERPRSMPCRAAASAPNAHSHVHRRLGHPEGYTCSHDRPFFIPTIISLQREDDRIAKVLALGVLLLILATYALLSMSPGEKKEEEEDDIIDDDAGEMRADDKSNKEL